MEQNSIVAMLDEEISRLQQLRSIMQSLLPGEAQVAPLLMAAAAEPEEEQQQVPAEVPSVTRHVSRRGISTGRRGPRQLRETAAPRPLDAAVPKTPVVVSRTSLAATKTAQPEATPESALEAWARSFRQAGSAAL